MQAFGKDKHGGKLWDFTTLNDQVIKLEERYA